MAGQVHFSRDSQLEGVAYVTLEHMGKFNAMSRAMWLQLRAVFESIQSDPQLRCVVVQGQGGHFCSGGDISEYPGFRFDARQLAHFHENEVWAALHAMLQCDVPVVARIEGNCMGAGMEIASCCDLRLASEEARFGAPIARLGFPMAPREAELVRGAVGDTTARAMLLAAEIFDAGHMLAQGFLLRAVPTAELSAQVQALAQRVVQLAPQAARLNKQTLRQLNEGSGRMEYAQAAMKNVAIGAGSAYAYADSAEHREGIEAFLQKRPAIF